MADDSLNTISASVEQQKQIVDLLQEIKKHLDAPKKRDLWDKAVVIGSIFSTVIITLVGIILTALAQRENSQTEKAAIIEKFLPHIAANDPSKYSAEMMIASLGYPDIVEQLASSDGDLQVLKDTLQTVSRGSNTWDAYNKSIKELGNELKDDQRCLQGTWQEVGKDHTWRFDVRDSRQLTITRDDHEASDLRKIGNRWEGTLRVDRTSFPSFQLIPQECPPDSRSKGADTNFGFQFARQ
jgi:hypothetical protein